jgi:hypothetical protein
MLQGDKNFPGINLDLVDVHQVHQVTKAPPSTQDLLPYVDDIGSGSNWFDMALGSISMEPLPDLDEILNFEPSRSIVDKDHNLNNLNKLENTIASSLNDVTACDKPCFPMSIEVMMPFVIEHYDKLGLKIVLEPKDRA